jgi:hypothetical protein
MSCLQALLAKLRFEKAEPILKMHELQKVLGHIARDMLARPNLRIKALVETIWARQSPRSLGVETRSPVHEEDTGGESHIGEDTPDGQVLVGPIHADHEIVGWLGGCCAPRGGAAHASCDQALAHSSAGRLAVGWR